MISLKRPFPLCQLLITTTNVSLSEKRKKEKDQRLASAFLMNKRPKTLTTLTSNKGCWVACEPSGQNSFKAEPGPRDLSFSAPKKFQLEILSGSFFPDLIKFHKDSRISCLTNVAGVFSAFSIKNLHNCAISHSLCFSLPPFRGFCILIFVIGSIKLLL